MRRCPFLLSALLAGFLVHPLAASESDEETSRGYAIVVSRATQADAEWQKASAALEQKHQGAVLVYEKDVAEVLPDLQKRMPRYTCFAARPEEASRQFVADVHRLTRKIDDDPYTDTLWGILTGYDAANALAIAQDSQALEIQRVASGTEISLECCPEGMWYSELKPAEMVRKKPGDTPRHETGPQDTTQALADALNVYKAQLFVSSGHATERDWQIGYGFRGGQFRSHAGQLTAIDTEGREFEINAPEPKVFLPVGNCLMGHIDGPDAMALAYMRSAGVRQMIGYTVLTWYGYAGWGCLDYFVEQPGRFTLAEAFFANEQSLLHRLETEHPDLADQDPPPGSAASSPASASPRRRVGLSSQAGAGLSHDRDVLAFYGDPAWEARLAPGTLRWEQTLTHEPSPNGGDELYTLTIRPLAGADSFAPVNTNGSQRGGRPIVQLLPRRLSDIKIVAGAELRPLITDDFVLVPLPAASDGKELRVVFSGK